MLSECEFTVGRPYCYGFLAARKGGSGRGWLAASLDSLKGPLSCGADGGVEARRLVLFASQWWRGGGGSRTAGVWQLTFLRLLQPKQGAALRRCCSGLESLCKDV